jgi:hypothetical protein
MKPRQRASADAITTLRTALRPNTSTILACRSGGGSLSFAGLAADSGSAGTLKACLLTSHSKA